MIRNQFTSNQKWSHYCNKEDYPHGKPIDITDKRVQRTERVFIMTLTTTLNNIKNKLNVTPTVLWSGRGYHIILSLTSNGIILENVKEFEGIPNISLRFLRYAELSLSLKKSDPAQSYSVIQQLYVKNTGFYKFKEWSDCGINTEVGWI